MEESRSTRSGIRIFKFSSSLMVGKITDTDFIQTYLEDYEIGVWNHTDSSCLYKDAEAINDYNYYLNPKKFVSLLEAHYNCNIFIFTRNFTNGEMAIPEHLQSYYRNRMNKQCIFIYQHIGSESDNADYPQCEIICKWKITDPSDITYNFKANSAVSKGVKIVYSKLKESYALDIKIKDNDMYNYQYEIDSLLQLVASSFLTNTKFSILIPKLSFL